MLSSFHFHKSFSTITFYHFGDASLCKFFHHPMLSILIAHGINFMEEASTKATYYNYTDYLVNPKNIKESECQQKNQDTNAQIPDILCFQPLNSMLLLIPLLIS